MEVTLNILTVNHVEVIEHIYIFHFDTFTPMFVKSFALVTAEFHTADN